LSLKLRFHLLLPLGTTRFDGCPKLGAGIVIAFHALLTTLLPLFSDLRTLRLRLALLAPLLALFALLAALLPLLSRLGLAFRLPRRPPLFTLGICPSILSERGRRHRRGHQNPK
jgi:hypothetical protein